MYENLRKPHCDLAAFLLRIGLGAIFMGHGYIKVSQPDSWTDVISRPMQSVVGWTEVVCGCLLFFGLLSRLASLGIVGVMIGAIAVLTGRRDFIVPDVGLHGFDFKASGYEYNVMIILACLAVVALGSGAFSVDHLIFGRRRGPKAIVSVPVDAPSPPSPAPVSPTSL